MKMFFSKEMKIALVVIAGIIALFFGMNFLKGLSFLANDNKYVIEFDDLSGVSVSSPIYAHGYRVGVVKSIDYDYTIQRKPRVEIELNSDMKVPNGTTAEIMSDMLGNVKINLNFPHRANGVLSVGDIIYGSTAEGALTKASALIPLVEKMLPKLDSILFNVNTLLADPALAHSLHNVEGITSNLTTSTKELNTLMASLNRNVPTMMGKANTTLDNTNKLTANLAKVDVSATMAKVDNAIENVQMLTQSLNSKEGSMGLLIRDPSLYNNLNSTMRSADSLLVDLRKSPKRYVHFSIFGNKNK